MNERVRVAVVGAGWWGGQHLRVLSALPNVEVVGVFGRSEARTQARAEEFGVPSFTDLAAMLHEGRPDLVSVCLPNQAHFEPTLQVIRAGIALIVEKPLVFDLSEADQLVTEADERNLFFAICFNHRYAQAVRMAEKAVDKGRLGALVLATWRFGGEGSTDHPYNNLIETQCHGFDMLEHLAGPIRSVAAQLTDTQHPGVFSTMAIALGFESGAVGSLVGSYDDSYGHPDVHVLELVGTKGRAVVEDTVRRFSFTPHGSETTEVWQPGYFNDRQRQFQSTMDVYLAKAVAAFAAGDDPPVHARAGRRALELAHAAIESSESGRRVDVTTTR